MQGQEIPVSVFIFYDSLEVLDQVRDIVMPCFSQIYSFGVESEQELIRHLQQKEFHGILCIFAFDQPGDSLRLKQQLDHYPELEKLRTIPGISMLVCDKQHRKSAYLLCENHQFYTYETIKPVYDIFRFQLTLYQLKDFILTQIQLHDEAQSIHQMSDELNASYEALDVIETKIEQEKQRQSTALKQVIKPLEQVLEQIPAGEWKRVMSRMINAHPDASGVQLSTLKKNLHDLHTLHDEFMDEMSFAIREVQHKDVKKEVTPLILAADDQPVMLKIISTILEPRGFKVETASNGAEALLKAKVMIPHVILLDIDMPVMDGFRTLKALQALPELEHVAVIMLTSFTDKSIFQKCIQCGAKDYIVKPTKGDILVKKIQKLMIKEEA
ncbi:Chemotaxis protein CheY [Vibrio aerogenes CECT 7868]|uniref:Chemotaxis protein CheY n=1 Tax=Vibrio aerogenes CECT 7868 TaxID=1216006 RepID=A0A1M6B690_9VIBR|nr:response regulator [Vibrio aerogenes]SHI44167.1 Chemotaxis protein CheY [Vibrio aerogenes CECT 7868]